MEEGEDGRARERRRRWLIALAAATLAILAGSLLGVLTREGPDSFRYSEDYTAFERQARRLHAMTSRHDVRLYQQGCQAQADKDERSCWEGFRLLLGERVRLLESRVEREQVRLEAGPCLRAMRAYYQALESARLVSELPDPQRGQAVLDEVRDNLDPYLVEGRLAGGLERCAPSSRARQVNPDGSSLPDSGAP